MSNPIVTPEMRALLKALTNAIIPQDERDGGAESVDAADQIAHRIEQGINGEVYLKGFDTAKQIATQEFNQTTEALTPEQAHQLVGALREHLPTFYKQLRMDVSAIYLSDPAVWARIGFPGPSIERGGYPEFDQPQY